MIVRIKLSIDIFQAFEFATLYGIFISEYRSLKFCRFFFFISRFLRQFDDFGGILRALVLFLFLSFFFFYNFCYNKPIVPTFRENSSGIDSILTQLFVSRRDKIFTDTRKEMVILNSDLLFKYYNPRFKYDLLHIIP